MATVAAAAVAIAGVRWDWRRLRYRRSFLFVGPRRALQDLYGDWSAIYRNRIPPYLTLPLARPSQPPLYLSGHFAFPLFPPRPLSLYPFSLLLLRASLCAGFIQSFAALTPSFASFLVVSRLSLFVPFWF